MGKGPGAILNFKTFLYFINRLLAGSRTRPSDFTFTFPFHALEKEMATHSSTLAWKIPWTKEPGRLQSMGSQRDGHDWTTSLYLTSDIIFNFCDLYALIWYMSRLLYQPHKVVWELTEITYKVPSTIPSIKCVQKSINHKSSQKEEEKLMSYMVWRI